ncbi:MAG: hypothetical protein ACXIUD_09650 [Mongoliitalea sp.]
MSKDTRKKTKRTKKFYRLTAEEVAELAGCSVSYVKKLRAELVNTNTPLAKQVLAIELLSNDGHKAVIKEIERIVS